MDKLTHYQVNKLCKLKPQGIVTIKYHAGGETIPVQLKTQLSLVETSDFVDYVILGPSQMMATIILNIRS